MGKTLICTTNCVPCVLICLLLCLTKGCLVIFHCFSPKVCLITYFWLPHHICVPKYCPFSILDTMLLNGLEVTLVKNLHCYLVDDFPGCLSVLEDVFHYIVEIRSVHRCHLLA